MALNRFVAVMAALTFASPAVAGDLSRPPVTPIWNGLYLGAHAGWGSSTVAGDGGSFDMTGGVAGAHVGINSMHYGAVLGIEADASAAGIEKSESLNGVTAKVQIDGFASVRGRIGAPVGNMIIYATAGTAYATGSATISGNGSGVTVNVSKFGYVGGGGIEARLSDTLSLRGETLYYGFSDLQAEGRSTGLHLSTTVVRAGVTWHLR